MNNLNISQLRQKCRENGLRVSGNKSKLVERLKESVMEDMEDTKEEEYEKYGKYKLGADLLISYGSENIIGFYKQDGMCYNRPSYSKLNEEGKLDSIEKIRLAYRSELDSCGNPHNNMYPGYWLIADWDFPWCHQTYKYGEVYNITNRPNDSYMVPLVCWKNKINIKML
jgi:hypothetical protein